MKEELNLSFEKKKPQAFVGKLDKSLEDLADYNNRELRQLVDNNLINPDGSISMEAFREHRDDVDADLEEAHRLEVDFSGIENSDIRAFYKDEYGADSIDDCLRAWKKNREKNLSALHEKATTIIFHKLLKDRAMALRPSKYDDYVNGVDHVVIDRKTGNVICAFDEVRGEKNDKACKNKEKKIMEIAQTGGIELKYGLLLREDKHTGEKKITRTAIKKIPTFYIESGREELINLLNGMDFDINSDPTKAEIAAFSRYIKSIKAQKNNIAKHHKDKKSFLRQVDQFTEMADSAIKEYQLNIRSAK